MKKLFAPIIVGAACLLAAVTSHAQNEGRQIVLNNIPLVSGATNSIAPGTWPGTFNPFIASGEYDKIGLMASSITGVPTNATGNIIIRLAKTDGVTTEATPSVVLTLPANSTNNNAVFTSVDATGVRGFYVVSLESSNLLSGGVPVNVTNLLSLAVNYQIPKKGAVPMTTQQ